MIALSVLLASRASAQLQGSTTISNFPQYAATLDAGQEADLHRVAVGLVGALLTGAQVSVSVYGHADFDAKGREFETAISRKRAQNAEASLRAFVNAEAAKVLLPSSRTQTVVYSAVGLGTLRPANPNPASEDERRDNRRIEIAWSVVPQLPVPPSAGSAFQRCVDVLRNATPPGAVRRMSCACQKLLGSPAAHDSHYDFRAARQTIPGSAGMPTLTLAQWHAAMQQLVHHMGQDIAHASANSPADPDFATSLIRLDDFVGANIDQFAMQATGGAGMGLFDQVILADIRARMATPGHVYSCYAGYSRRNHDN